MRSWGPSVSPCQKIDLTQWLRGHGFAAVQPGNHISIKVGPSSRILAKVFEEAKSVCRNDARVALLSKHAGSSVRAIDVAHGPHDGRS